MERFTVVETKFGAFGMVARGSRLVATYLPRPPKAVLARIRSAFPDAVEDGALLPRLQRAVAAYFGGMRVRFAVNVNLSDQPPYRRVVLETCRRVPFGETATYADLARATGNPSAARAVGSAMANNPLPLVVPCHRIVCSDGSLGGFTSPLGIRQKQRLLAIEGIDANSLLRDVKTRSRRRAVKVA